MACEPFRHITEAAIHQEMYIACGFFYLVHCSRTEQQTPKKGLYSIGSAFRLHPDDGILSVKGSDWV
jgi:hypothetical protein